MFGGSLSNFSAMFIGAGAGRFAGPSVLERQPSKTLGHGLGAADRLNMELMW